MQRRKVSGSVFAGGDIEIDNTDWDDNVFNQCVMVYRGGPLPFMSNNRFVDCKWRFEDGAARTIGLLQSLHREGFTDLTEFVISTIRGEAKL